LFRRYQIGWVTSFSFHRYAPGWGVFSKSQFPRSRSVCAKRLDCVRLIAAFGRHENHPFFKALVRAKTPLKPAQSKRSPAGPRRCQA